MLASNIKVVSMKENPRFREYVKRVSHESTKFMTAFMYADIRDKIVKKALKKPFKKNGQPTKALEKRRMPGSPFVWRTPNGSSGKPKYFVMLTKSKYLDQDQNANNNFVAMQKEPWSRERDWFKKMEQGGMTSKPSDVEVEKLVWKYVRTQM